MEIGNGEDVQFVNLKAKKGLAIYGFSNIFLIPIARIEKTFLINKVLSSQPFKFKPGDSGYV